MGHPGLHCILLPTCLLTFTLGFFCRHHLRRCQHLAYCRVSIQVQYLFVFQLASVIAASAQKFSVQPQLNSHRRKSVFHLQYFVFTGLEPTLLYVSNTIVYFSNVVLAQLISIRLKWSLSKCLLQSLVCHEAACVALGLHAQAYPSLLIISEIAWSRAC